MRNVTIRALLAHKVRLALTSLAIVLGVTFVAGTLVLTDTLHTLFDSLVGTVYEHIDFEVRGVAQFPTSDAASAVRNPLPEQLLSVVRDVPGVGAADGRVSGYAQFISPKGSPVSTGGAPTIGENYDPDARTSQLHIVEGSPPTGPDDVVMDAGTAKRYGFHVGQRVVVIFNGPPETFVLSGIGRVGSADNLAGISLAEFSLPTAQRAMDKQGQFDFIEVEAKPGADKATVEGAIARVLPAGAEVVTGQTLVDEETSSINRSLSSFSTALLVFAFISLFVGAFTIFNTFSITVGQRTRELALLRIVGASRRQILTSVLGEAAIVGLISSLAGTGLGVLSALGLEALLDAFGVSLPSGPLVFEARTLVVALVVGVGVTVVSAISPARRAVRVAPIAALSDLTMTTDVTSRRRVVSGSTIGALGALFLAIGLSAPLVALVGLGAAGLFTGVAMLAPTVARPLSAWLGRPLARMLAAPGKLGRENSMRNPRRTAQTASALMVGIALVSAMAVFGASLSSSATSAVNDAVRADLIITGTSAGSGEFSSSLATALAHLRGVTASSVVYGGQFEFRQSLEHLGAVSAHDLGATVILHIESGTSAALGRGQLLVDAPTASADHLSVGDLVPVKFALTGRSMVRIGGIFKANALIGSYLSSAAYYLSHFTDHSPGGVLLATSAPATVEKEVAHLLAPYPTVQVQTRSQFQKAQISAVNQLLGLIYALLGLAVIIAAIGIVNSMMLSVFERTREIGLLRAVGMKRRQVRTMVRSESVIVALFGAVIGIVIGTGLGTALTASLKLTNLAVPVPNLVIFLVLSGVLGIVAATWPARRAANLDVLQAIATE